MLAHIPGKFFNRQTILWLYSKAFWMGKLSLFKSKPWHSQKEARSYQAQSQEYAARYIHPR